MEVVSIGDGDAASSLPHSTGDDGVLADVGVGWLRLEDGVVPRAGDGDAVRWCLRW